MFCAFFSLLMICGGIGVLVWLAWQRITAHLRKNPEAAKLVSQVIAEHIIPPLLTGEPEAMPEATRKVQTTE